MAQTEDKYPFATIYNQELALYTFNQGSMTNPQWYEPFNTNIDVSRSIGVNQQHKALLEYVAQESHSLDFKSCTQDQQEAVRTDSEESYLYYALLRQSGNQHRKLKVDLQNDFTTRNNLYPKSRTQTLHLLEKYSKIAASKFSAYEGSSFSQGDVNKGNGGRGGRNKRVGDDKTYDKRYCKEKECYKCGEKLHPESHFTKTKKDKDNDEKITNSTISKSSVKNLEKDVKKMSRAFNTVNTQLQKLKDTDYDLYDL